MSQQQKLTTVNTTSNARSVFSYKLRNGKNQNALTVLHLKLLQNPLHFDTLPFRERKPFLQNPPLIGAAWRRHNRFSMTPAIWSQACLTCRTFNNGLFSRIAIPYVLIVHPCFTGYIYLWAYICIGCILIFSCPLSTDWY